MDKDTVLKLLDEKKLTDTLMKDKDFISEAKAILKEESPDITDENLEKILKSVEKVLSGEVKIENDDDLENVAGGLGTTGKKIARGAIKTVCTTAGLAGGVVGSAFIGGNGKRLYNIASETPFYDNNGHITHDTAYKVTAGAMLVAAGGGTLLGNKFGNFLCDKLGLNN